MSISTVLKVTGILIAGVLGILGIVTKTKDDDTTQLTNWGRWALYLTIAGSVLALGSQIADSISDSKKDHEILMGLQDQSTKAGKILDQNSVILSGVRDQSTATANILRQDGNILEELRHLPLNFISGQTPRCPPAVAVKAFGFIVRAPRFFAYPSIRIRNCWQRLWLGQEHLPI